MRSCTPLTKPVLSVRPGGCPTDSFDAHQPTERAQPSPDPTSLAGPRPRKAKERDFAAAGGSLLGLASGLGEPPHHRHLRTDHRHIPDDQSTVHVRERAASGVAHSGLPETRPIWAKWGALTGRRAHCQHRMAPTRFVTTGLLMGRMSRSGSATGSGAFRFPPHEPRR